MVPLRFTRSGGPPTHSQQTAAPQLLGSQAYFQIGPVKDTPDEPPQPCFTTIATATRKPTQKARNFPGVSARVPAILRRGQTRHWLGPPGVYTLHSEDRAQLGLPSSQRTFPDKPRVAASPAPLSCWPHGARPVAPLEPHGKHQRPLMQSPRITRAQ